MPPDKSRKEKCKLPKIRLLERKDLRPPIAGTEPDGEDVEAGRR